MEISCVECNLIWVIDNKKLDEIKEIRGVSEISEKLLCLPEVNIRQELDFIIY